MHLAEKILLPQPLTFGGDYLMTPLRVDLETEANGLDLSVRGERAYEVNS